MMADGNGWYSCCRRFITSKSTRSDNCLCDWLLCIKSKLTASNVGEALHLLRRVTRGLQCRTSNIEATGTLIDLYTIRFMHNGPQDSRLAAPPLNSRAWTFASLSKSGTLICKHSSMPHLSLQSTVPPEPLPNGGRPSVGASPLASGWPGLRINFSEAAW